MAGVFLWKKLPPIPDNPSYFCVENNRPVLFTIEEIKQKMAAYCAYQERSHQEVEEKLRTFNLIEEAREEVILFLMRENFLNEERFAQSYARGKFYIKKWGRQKIKSQLKMKGVGERLITQGLKEINAQDYHRAAAEIFEKYYRQVSAKNDFERRSKSVRYLMSRGYEYEIIQNVLEDLELRG